MVNRGVILCASLALNIGLLAGLYALRRTLDSGTLPPRPLRIDPGPARSSPPAPGASKPRPPSPANSVAPEPSPALSFHWSHIASTNDLEYRDRLRAVGCPEATVRDILKAEINAEYARRRQPLVAEFQRQFWTLAAAGSIDPSDAGDWQEAEFERLDEEREARLEAVLGREDADEDADDLSRRRQRWAEVYGWLPPEKRDALLALLENQERQERELSLLVSQRGEGWTPADHARRKALAEELERARTQLLSPAELEEYRLRVSHEAQWAQSLAGFEPTEGEWRAVAQLRSDYENARQQLGRAALSKEEKQARQKELQAELEDATRTALGPERYAEVERARDSQYQSLRRVVHRHGLTDATAAQAYGLVQTARDQMQHVRDDKSLTTETRLATLRALQAEAEAALRQSLGGAVFDTYREYGGDWLQEPAP
ncbi:MAG TPA: hypothetical protein PKM73_00860 [Verrucomicrobiota bacterium]|nr:hypothetical protein [Verrucomicrobiota bacterium]HNU49893.1 hypothetical protein [Verrucomicrobiota bacterium]